MRRYIFNRVVLAVVTIFVVMTLTFFLMHSIPGTPFSGGNGNLSEESLDILMSRYGLNRPIFQQYLTYVSNILRGDFGVSMSNNYRSVTDIILKAFPVSADLGLRALIFGAVAGILLGIEAALHRNRAVDRLSTIVAIIGISVPSFVLGTVLQTVLGLGASQLIKNIFHTDFQLFPIARWETFRQAINSEISGGDFFNADDKQLGLFFIEPDGETFNEKKFANKVLKYLWTDVFKRNTDQIFKADNLSKVVEDFTGADAFDKVFVDTFAQTLNNTNDEIKNK